MVKIEGQLIHVLLLGVKFLFLYFELELVLVLGDREGETTELVLESVSNKRLWL